MRLAGWHRRSRCVAVAARSADDDATPTAIAPSSIASISSRASIGGHAPARVPVRARARGPAPRSRPIPRRSSCSSAASEKKAPYALGRYGATDADTAIVLVVETTQRRTPTRCRRSPTRSTRRCSRRCNEHDAGRDPDVRRRGRRPASSAPVQAARTASVVGLASDGSAAEPALLDTVDRALICCSRSRRPTPHGRPLRKMIVVIGDGRDRSGDRERVTQLGKRAAKDGVRIHTLGVRADRRRAARCSCSASCRSSRSARSAGSAARRADSWSAGARAAARRDRQAVRADVLPRRPTSSPARSSTIATVGTHRDALARTRSRSARPAAPGSRASGYCADDHCVVPARRRRPRRARLDPAASRAAIAVGRLIARLVVIGCAAPPSSRAARPKRRRSPPPAKPGRPRGRDRRARAPVGAPTTVRGSVLSS